MKQSPEINAIAAALSKAQGEMKPAVFDKKNPHYNSKYATLTSIMEAVKEPLSKNGISIVQSLTGPRDAMTIVTRIVHSSGQWIEDDGIPLILDKNTMQGLGSAISYAKRYGVSALLSVVSDEDDDGNAAEDNAPKMQVKSVETVKNGKAVANAAKPQPKVKPAPVIEEQDI